MKGLIQYNIKKFNNIDLLFSKKKLFVLYIFLFLSFNYLSAQNTKVEFTPDYTKRGNNELRVVFYNAENLFDPYNDSIKSDEEYTPTGMRGWTYGRMIRKQVNLSKSLMAIGGFTPPEIIGLCEIENKFVLAGLLKNTPLKNYDYKIAHFESPDFRGIDVALLYNPKKYKVYYQNPINISFPTDTASRTRDILHVSGLTENGDTLHIFVNHWPSKFGGALATIQKRNHVASILRSKVDSLLQINSNTKILIMGDFNDGPNEESILNVLNAKLDSTNLNKFDLYNTVYGYSMAWDKGTIKFRGEWEIIDHIIISSGLTKNSDGLRVKKMGLTIFEAPFLLQDDETWFGKKPYRTYYGARYIGGFSDHLPVYIDLTY